MNPPLIRLLLLSMSLPAGAVCAQTAAEDRAARLDHARVLHQEAETIRAEADQRLNEAQTECWQKFFVNACLGDARDAQRRQVVKARELDKQARDIEREVKREELAEREARRAAEAPAKEEAARARAEKRRQAAEEAQQRVEQKQDETAGQPPQ